MHLKRRLGVLLMAVFCLLATVYGQTNYSTPPFRVVGYYSLKAAMEDTLSTIPFDKLTHINLWFLNPDSLGNFVQDLSLLRPFVEAAHANNIKVLFSIGGGSKQPQYHRLLQEENRQILINNLVAVVRNNNADGIDIDLEGGDIDENYEPFVTGLAAALRPMGKLTTAAIAVYYKDALTDGALAQFDFVNVMSYDRTGPWRPEKPGPHATFTHAAEDIDYFAVERRIPKEKMVLGVPFYGYGFGPDTTSQAISMNYRDIITQFPGAEQTDEWKMPDGKILYYNGLPTIRHKTTLAKEKASGIMIWQLKGDAGGKFSLLNAINEVAKENR